MQVDRDHHVQRRQGTAEDESRAPVLHPYLADHSWAQVSDRIDEAHYLGLVLGGRTHEALLRELKELLG